MSDHDPWSESVVRSTVSSSTRSSSPHGNQAADDEHEPRHEWLFWTAVGLYFLIGPALWVWMPSDLKILSLVAWGALLLSSVRFRSSNRFWGYRAFGYNLFATGGGFMLEIPFFMDHPVSMPKTFRQRQFPEEPENVYQGDDQDSLPMRTDGTGHKMRPLRIITGPSQDKYNSNPNLNVQITTKATGTVRYRVKKDFFFDFWVRIGGHTPYEKYQEIERQMYDTWGKTVKREWEKLPVAGIIDQADSILDKLEKDLINRVVGLGIDIEEVNLQSPDLSHEVAIAQISIPMSLMTAQATRTSADAEGYKRKVEGQGTADAELASMKAEGDGVEYQSGKIGITGREAFAAKTAVQVMGPRDKLLFGGPSAIAQMLAGGKEIIGALDAGTTKEGEK